MAKAFAQIGKEKIDPVPRMTKKPRDHHLSPSGKLHQLDGRGRPPQFMR
jgi:hypothetical protein